MHRLAFPILAAVLAMLVPGASAQLAGAPFGAVDGGTVGYELALHGSASVERGADLRFAGTAYEVSGAATLRGTSGLEVEAVLERANDEGLWDPVATRTVRAGAGGRFEVAIPMPESELGALRAHFVVRRAGAPGRHFTFAVEARSARRIDLLTDRARYEPGETAHVWTRITRARGGAPSPDRPLRITLSDPRGVVLLTEERTSGPSGAASVDLPLAETLEVGTYTVQVESDPTTALATRRIEIFARTTERMAATITLDADLVLPGAPLGGVVRVTDPSGAPLPGASIELRASSASYEPILLTSGRDGTARFTAAAPAFVYGDVGYESVTARVVHPSAGTIAASAGYTIARTAWLVSATPEGGALVPEVETRLYVAVADPRGTPLPAGVTLEARGLSIPGGRATATTDGHGLAEIVLELPRGAAARWMEATVAARPRPRSRSRSRRARRSRRGSAPSWRSTPRSCRAS